MAPLKSTKIYSFKLFGLKNATKLKLPFQTNAVTHLNLTFRDSLLQAGITFSSLYILISVCWARFVCWFRDQIISDSEKKKH